MSWRTVLELDCGCELRQLYAPHSVQHGEVTVLPVGRCRKHLCRVCGAVPLADYEPDRLCDDCGDATSERRGSR